MDMPRKHTELDTAPIPVTITVTIVSDKPPMFDLAGDGVIPVKKITHQDGGEDWMLTFNNFDAAGDYHDGFTITFDLIDNTGKNYGFFQDPDAPLPSDAVSTKCVGKSGHCPRRGQQWESFIPDSVSPDRKTLVVVHPNDYLQYFGFALHFSTEGEKKPSLSFDPIGNDQNGHQL